MKKTLITAAAIVAIGVAGPAMADPAPVDDNGYKQITIEDFLLDGKALAKEHRAISLTGTHVRESKTDWLYPPNVWPRNRNQTNGVLLINDDATR